MMWRVTDLRRADGRRKKRNTREEGGGGGAKKKKKVEEITIGRKGEEGRAVKENEKTENKKKIHM